MKKAITIFLSFLLMTSCIENNNRRIDKSQIKNKTFNLISESQTDTLIVDFRDSTYNILEYYRKDNPWNLSYFEKSSILTLDDNVFGLKEIDKGTFECTQFSQIESIVTLKERESKWNQEMLFGTWTEDKYIGTDSTDFPPPPIEDIKTEWPPYYVISKDKIVYNFYKQTESKIRINSTSEYISLELNDPVNYGINDKFWQVITLTDSIMILNKIVNYTYPSYKTDIKRGITLIKKR
jgi:hypothetical protein